MQVHCSFEINWVRNREWSPTELNIFERIRRRLVGCWKYEALVFALSRKLVENLSKERTYIDWELTLAFDDWDIVACIEGLRLIVTYWDRHGYWLFDDWRVVILMSSGICHQVHHLVVGGGCICSYLENRRYFFSWLLQSWIRRQICRRRQTNLLSVSAVWEGCDLFWTAFGKVELHLENLTKLNRIHLLNFGSWKYYIEYLVLKSGIIRKTQTSLI